MNLRPDSGHRFSRSAQAREQEWLAEHPEDEETVAEVPRETAERIAAMRAASAEARAADLKRAQLASWGSRVGATLIDDVALVGCWVAVWLATGHSFPAHYHGTGERLLVFVASTAFAALYLGVTMWRTNGQTLGKLIAGIRVVRTTREPISLPFALWREIVLKVLIFQTGILWMVDPGLPLWWIWFVDVLWPLWDRENRALHDYLADSRVLRASAQPVDPEPSTAVAS